MNTEGYEMTEREAIAMLHTMTARYPEARIMYLLDDRWNVEAGLRCVFPDGQQGFCPFGSEIALSADAVLGHEIWFKIPIDTAGFGLRDWNDARPAILACRLMEMAASARQEAEAYRPESRAGHEGTAW